MGHAALRGLVPPAGQGPAGRWQVSGTARIQSNRVGNLPADEEAIIDSSSTPWDLAFEELVRAHLSELPATRPLAPDLSLRASGLNSYSAVTLLARIEAVYGLRLPDDLLTFETFETPAVLWAAIARAGATAASEQEDIRP